MIKLLAFSGSIKNVKGRIVFTLSVLPFGLGFLSILPLFMFGEWLGKFLGIPPDAPVKEQANGLTYLVVILAAFVILFLSSYIVGWLANAMICRYIFGWPKEEVKAVFVRSVLPARWFISSDE